MGDIREFKRPGPLLRAWLMIEGRVNLLTTSIYNPFYYTGAIGIFFLWIILVTGIYLFIFYTITADGAYSSVEYLTVEQWYLGGVMRSLHRYASDGLVIIMVIHAIQCLVKDRFRHWRWVAWVTGVVIAWIVWIGGIFGYWMVWDLKAQLVAMLSAEMIESVPIFGLPLSLNFARPENLTDQLFYIVLFIHFSSIFFLFILFLIHLTRITRAVITPPRAVIYALLLVLMAIAFIKPAVSAPPADLKHVPGVVPFDWFFMFIFPLLNYTSPRGLWLFIVFSTLIVALVPWLGRTPRRPPAEVLYENCTGCELCMEDCPYVAIQIRPRTDGRPYPLEAVVTPGRCASCGICVGACDYSAIELPDLREGTVKEMIRRLCLELKDEGPGLKVFVFACARSAWSEELFSDDGRIKGMDGVRCVWLPCIGMLQPSMLSIPFDEGVDGVFISSCIRGDCHYRRGNEWLAGRLAGLRPPVVRRSVVRGGRVRVAWLSAVQTGEFIKGLEEFKQGLSNGGR